MRSPFAVISALLATSLFACSQSTQIIGLPLAMTCDSMSQRCIIALFKHDKAGLLALGLSDEKAMQTLAIVGSRLDSSHGEFLFDGMVAMSYCGQYRVSVVRKEPNDPENIQIRVWFRRNSHDKPYVDQIQIMEPQEN